MPIATAEPALLVNEHHRDEIIQMLNHAQSRCSVRLLHYVDILVGIRAVEQQLVPLPKAMRTGIRAELRTNSPKVASSYRGIPEETVATVVRRPSGWAVAQIERLRLKPDRMVSEIVMSAGQAEALTSRLLEERRIRVAG